jgi:anti-anti-sigma factor
MVLEGEARGQGGDAPPFGFAGRVVDGRPHAYEVTLTGEINIDVAPTIDRELDALIAADARFVVLDLSDVSFLDSSGIRSIVRAARTLSERDGRLTCRGLSGAAGRVLEVSGLLEHLRDDDER